MNTDDSRHRECSHHKEVDESVDTVGKDKWLRRKLSQNLGFLTWPSRVASGCGGHATGPRAAARRSAHTVWRTATLRNLVAAL